MSLSSKDLEAIVLSFTCERVFDEFLGTGDIIVRSEHGETILGIAYGLITLHVLPFYEGIKIIRRLVANGVDMNAKNKSGLSVFAVIIGNFISYRTSSYHVLQIIAHNGVEIDFRKGFFPGICDQTTAKIVAELHLPDQFYSVALYSLANDMDMTRRVCIEVVFVVDVLISTF